MALIRMCSQCEQETVVRGRLLCAECAETLDDGLVGLLEASSSEG